MNTIKGSANDFTGSADEWEERVVMNATHFRLHRFVDNLQWQMQCETFERAVTLAIAALGAQPNTRVLLYAVSPEGRHIAVPQKKWAYYLDKWNKRNEASSNKDRSANAVSTDEGGQGRRQSRRRKGKGHGA